MKLSFSSLNLSESVSKALANMEYVEPTPVQGAAIPVALNGDDLLAVAQTGTGKTLAFLIPVMEMLLQKKRRKALIIAPTRELVQQIALCAKKFFEQRGFERNVECPLKSLAPVVTLIGGQNIELQKRSLRSRFKIVVGTPGRTIDHIQRNNLDPKSFDMVVLDEADRMFDMGFWPQLQTIFESLPEERQTIMFSATFGQAERRLASKFMRAPKILELVQKATPVKLVKQEILFINNDKKFANLVQLLNKREGSVIVFVRTKISADRLAKKLYESNHDAMAIHGDLRQSRRTKVVQMFSKGLFRVMVATDVAARGLDIPSVGHVVNYDLPDQFEDYVHRIGRTGRAGKEGSALCFCTDVDRQKFPQTVRAIGQHGTVIQAL